jgi:hypothetical protein
MEASQVLSLSNGETYDFNVKEIGQTSNQNLNDDDAVKIANALKTNQTLLKLSFCSIQ